MTNHYGVELHDESVRWAAAECVSETVIAAICLLDERSIDEIVGKPRRPLGSQTYAGSGTLRYTW
jgi:hypothetical protein